MTKYLSLENTALDSELRAIIHLVLSTVADCGFEPLLADENNLHDYLWDNVVCHMLACSYGIAIVESKFRPELNPNVAMEWGWKRAMRKPVLWLIEKDAEKDLKFVPADVGGLIRAPFDWEKPQAHIANAITKYFQAQQVSRLP
jgi:nucleoside 2-deoxyribosyltransferase